MKNLLRRQYRSSIPPMTLLKKSGSVNTTRHGRPSKANGSLARPTVLSKQKPQTALPSPESKTAPVCIIKTCKMFPKTPKSIFALPMAVRHRAGWRSAKAGRTAQAGHVRTLSNRAHPHRQGTTEGAPCRGADRSARRPRRTSSASGATRTGFRFATRTCP